ncbi:MAG: CRTAC1 family protein [Phycisphaerales bacterium]|nr:CRTAC1 family protein [Phycisphaerales bacterium]
MIDFNRDGWYDLFISDFAGRPKRLFQNSPSPTAPGGRTFVDVSATAGFTIDPDGISRSEGGVVIFDFNNDGWDDIFTLAESATDQGLLYRNNQNGTFSNVTLNAGLKIAGINALCASATDFDLDGNVDLMVASSGTPSRFITLWRNRGDGTFQDRSDLVTPLNFAGVTYAMGFTDYDHDGWSDALIPISAGTPLTLKNVPNPAGGRMFIDTTQASGFTFVGPAPMGIAFGDVNNDGWLDVAITDAISGTYYENRAGTLVRVRPYTTFFGWGTVYIDAENDGDVDNYQAGSHSTISVDFLVRNNGDGTFTDARPALNTTRLASQQCVKIDFDNDGREDVITINPGSGFISIYHNQSSSSMHWSKILLQGADRANANAVGAVVRMTAGGRTQVREVALGTSYASTDDPRLHFGLGETTVIDQIEIIWPRAGTLADRTENYAGPFPSDRTLVLGQQRACLADADRNGLIETADLFTYINIWLNSQPAAEIDNNGIVNTLDLFAFLNAWFVGCP